MKKLNKYLQGACLAALLTLVSVSVASAQHSGGHSSGGGGGSHFSSGGSGGVGYSHSGATSFYRNGFTGSRSNYYYGGYGYGGFYRPGFGYFGYPQLGFYINTLPFGYYPFYWGSDLYYYNDGIFFRPYDNGGYEVTVPPVGAAVPTLPEDAKSIVIDNQQYYESNGVYYKVILNDQGKKVYMVAGKDGVLNTDNGTAGTQVNSAPQVGDMVYQLPDNCRKVTLNGKKYLVSPNDIYYEETTDNSGNIAYRIASLPEAQ